MTGQVKNIKLCLAFWFLAVLVFICGCSVNTRQEQARSEQKPVIAVSIVPQATFVKAVAGDLVNIVTLIPPGNSPANYSPSPEQLEQLSRSSLYFTIGVPAETANILPRLKNINKNIKIIDLAAEVGRVYPDREFAPGKRDPHIWLSLKRAQVIIDRMAEELAKIDSDNQAVFAANAANYKNKLEQLDHKISNSTQEQSGKAFIVYHPAFGYFADDYNLKMISIEKDGKTATAKDIQDIINFARADGIKVIFYQASIASNQADTIAAEIGGHTEMVDPLAADYLDNFEKMATVFVNAAK